MHNAARVTCLSSKPGSVVFALCVACFATKGHADDVRAFNADTPGRGYTPYTVAQGYFQVESDSFHITEQSGTQTIEFLDPVFKYGLTNIFEIDLQTNGLFDVTSRAQGKTTHMFGYGDTTPSFKWGLIGDDSQAFSASFKFGVKIPTAAPGIGNGAVEYNAILPTQFALPANLTLQVQEEIDLLKNQDDTGKHFSFGEAVSVSRAFGDLTVSAEFFAQSSTDPHNQALYTADLGLSYAVTPVIVISAGTYVGLNRYAAQIEAYTGFGFRF